MNSEWWKLVGGNPPGWHEAPKSASLFPLLGGKPSDFDDATARCQAVAFNKAKARVDSAPKQASWITELLAGKRKPSNAVPSGMVPFDCAGKRVAIATTPVTQAEFLAVMGINPSRFTGNDRCPVERVSWYDVIAYCNERSRREGLASAYAWSGAVNAPGESLFGLLNVEVVPGANGYRLPTEEEWKTACCAGRSGDDVIATPETAWTDESTGGTTHPVGLLQPNPWGLYDMLGNMWEWTETPEDSFRILRSGSWDDVARLARAAYRNFWRTPGDRFAYLGFRLAWRTPGTRSADLGFRLARTL